MKKLIFAIVILFGSVAIFFSVESQRDQAKHGKYLVETIGACGQCHTPRKGADPDPNYFLAGHPKSSPFPTYDFKMMRQSIFMLTSPTMTAFAGPFGIVFASNLTPDPETGLGEWTEEMFVKAMKNGHHLGDQANRKILPPMPIRHYKNMTDEDLKAIWAYLRTIKPIRNEVPSALNPRGKPY